MQENEFERIVQQSMDTFHLHPSDGVWQKLEKDLKEKKRRRIFFFWLFSSVLLCGGGMLYYWMNPPTENGKQIVQSNPSSPTHTPVKDTHEKTDMTPGTLHEKDKSVVRVDVATEKGAEEKSIDNISPGITESSSKRKTIKQRNEKNTTNKKVIVGVTNKVNKEKLTARIDEKKIDGTANELKNDKEKNTQQIDNSVNENIADDNKTQSTSVNKPADSIAVDSLVMNDTALVINTKKSQSSKSSKIRWAVDVSGGMNSAHESAFSFHQQSAAATLRDQQMMFAGLPQRRLPSAVKSGISFTVGLTGELRISQRSSIAVSPMYKYTSEQIRIGALVNGLGAATNATGTRPGRVYESGGNHPYNNKYHSAGVGIHYQLQLNKGRKIAIIWNAGFTPFFLLSTNGLVYDTASNGIYYHDKNAFRKFNINASAGFYFKFGRDQSIQWAVGPQFSFQLSSLMKNEAVEPKRFQMFSGVAARIYLPKKK